MASGEKTELPDSDCSIAKGFCLSNNRELRDSDEVEVKELDELVVALNQLSWAIQAGETMTSHLLVDESDACTGMPPVFLKRRCEIPTLEPPEAANNGACAMAAQIAHHHDWVGTGLKQDVPVKMSATEKRRHRAISKSGLSDFVLSRDNPTML